MIAIFNHLTQFKLISETTSIIVLAIKLNYPFLYVIVMNYLVCAVIGGYLFGGNISSQSPDQMAAVGQATKPEYRFHNWNDFTASLVFLYSIQLNNNIPMYVSISTVNEGPTRNFKPIFFVLFYFINNIILIRIFVGQIIEISLEYFKSIDKEDKHFKVYDQTPSVERIFYGGEGRQAMDGDTRVIRVKV